MQDYANLLSTGMAPCNTALKGVACEISSYLRHELVNEGIHEIGLPLLPMDDSHKVKGHSVVVLESQQLCDLPQVSPCLLGEGLVRLQKLGNSVRVLLL